MSESVAAPAAPAPSTPATDVATELTPNPNMTGAEARAYVEAQKAKAAEGKPATGKATTEGVQDALKEVMKKYKVKVNGEEMEVDEGELLKGYSHQKAANKILQEGKLLRKQAEDFVSLMKDPQKFFDAAKRLGHDPRTLAEKYLVTQLEDEMLDPRDRELREAKGKLKAIEEMEAKQKAKVEADRIEVLKKKFAQDYTTQFTEALSKTSVPATKHTVAEMAKYIARSAEIGFEMTAIEAAQLVREDIQLAQQRLIGDSDGEMLIKLLGEDVAKKVRKWDTSRLKNPEGVRAVPLEQQSTAKETRRPSNKRMSSKEWRQFNRS